VTDAALCTPVSRPVEHGRPSALQIEHITAGYARTTVLRDVSIDVPKGSIVALLGPNGAGKTTLLRTAVGLLRPSHGAIRVDGTDVTRTAPNRRSRAGLCLIPEGRGIFRGLTVRENFLMHVPAGSRHDKQDDLQRVLEIFPILRDRMNQTAGTMSGGQQQMLAIARSFLSHPKVVLLDEVSMGLAPNVVDEIFEIIGKIAAAGTALVLVEQYVTRALELADTVVLLDRGAVAYNGPADSLDESAVLRGYLGVDVERPAALSSG
jgi:branched-chain amino acid transport system ATP-binding protein